MRICRFVPALLFLSCLMCATASAEEAGALFRVKEHGKWGFIDTTGTIVIPPQYDDCYYQFSEGLAAVKVGTHWGYIDKTGKMIIPPQFDGAVSFHHGLAAVRMGEPFAGKGKWGYINRDGRYVLEPADHFSYSGFDDGLMPVKMDGKWGYIDTAGKLVIPCVYASAYKFSGGLAGVCVDDHHGGFINTKGEWVIRLASAIPDYDGFAEGLAPVMDVKSQEYGYIDTTGSFVIAPRFTGANGFRDGRAVVVVAGKDDTGWPTSTCGAIDKTGAFIVPATYETLWSFEEGMAKAIDAKGNGFVDLAGDLAIPCTFTTVDPFWNGLAFVRVGHITEDATGWDGYIDKKGTFVWRPSDFAARDEARSKTLAKEKSRKPSILLLNDIARGKKGLVVTCPKRIPLAGDSAITIPISVINLLDEEVFIAVTSNESLGYTLETWDGGHAASGGSFTVFPDNTHLLKRLHAASSIGGKPSACGCCRATIMGKLDKSVRELGRARGTIAMRISGYFRKSGQEFFEFIELPIELVDDSKDQPGNEPAKE